MKSFFSQISISSPLTFFFLYFLSFFFSFFCGDPFLYLTLARSPDELET